MDRRGFIKLLPATSWGLVEAVKSYSFVTPQHMREIFDYVVEHTDPMKLVENGKEYHAHDLSWERMDVLAKNYAPFNEGFGLKDTLTLGVYHDNDNGLFRVEYMLDTTIVLHPRGIDINFGKRAPENYDRIGDSETRDSLIPSFVKGEHYVRVLRGNEVNRVVKQVHNTVFKHGW